jgi:Flp pilus assembly protein TadD
LADEAAALFRDVLDKKAGNQTARRGLALALISMGQPELAERQLEAALLADGRDYRTLNAYGVVLDMMGRHAEAQARYRQGIELAPEYLPLRSNFGLSLAISGQPQEAIAQLTPLANSRGADRRVRQNLAFAYAMNGDLENCLLVNRKDLDEQSAQRQLSYFMQLRSLPIEARSAELRRNPSFFP